MYKSLNSELNEGIYDSLEKSGINRKDTVK